MWCVMVEKALGFGSSYMVCITEYSFGNAHWINTVLDITFGTVANFTDCVLIFQSKLLAASQLDPQGFDRFFAVFIPFTKNLANFGNKNWFWGSKLPAAENWSWEINQVAAKRPSVEAIYSVLKSVDTNLWTWLYVQKLAKVLNSKEFGNSP